ncbi:MAG: hypothetical protein IT293_03260 [Deltaproteobacteria bacterium]|nr:hypothetical protein [Deltaproteobacteria bacterium]
MRIAAEQLIDGVVQTLIDAVLPDVASPFARGQLYAAVDVLRNLRDRVEPRADQAEEESASAVAALDRALAALADAAPALADRLRAALAAAPAAPPPARVAAVRAVLADALEAIATLPADVARAARRPLAEHLGAQVMRDVAPLKPSMLGEISRG